MADENWYRVKAIPTTDTAGKPASLFVGQVEIGDRLETVVRIDSGPIALAPLEELGEFLKALRQTGEDTHKRNHRSQP